MKLSRCRASGCAATRLMSGCCADLPPMPRGRELLHGVFALGRELRVLKPDQSKPDYPSSFHQCLVGCQQLVGLGYLDTMSGQLSLDLWNSLSQH